MSSAQAEQPVVKIGLMVCLSGQCADWGTASMRGAQLAVEEINTSGGVSGRQLALVVEDTSESVSGARAVSAFRKLRTFDGVDIFIGPSWSPGAKAILPLVKDSEDLILITPSASFPEFARSGDHLFNMRASYALMSQALARYSFEQGFKRAAVFSTQQPAQMENGRVFDSEFRKLGGEITLLAEPVPVDPDLRSVATRIVRTEPEVVFIINYNHMAEAAKQLRTLGYRGPMLTISVDQARLEASGGALEGVITANFPGATDSFQELFTTRFGEEPGLSAEGGYDAVYAIARAASKAKSFNVSELKAEIATVSFDGASGQVSFDAHGQLIQEPVLMRAVGTKLVKLENG